MWLSEQKERAVFELNFDSLFETFRQTQNKNREKC